jgi:formylglycine-generating enzyme required for sulfatase activity
MISRVIRCVAMLGALLALSCSRELAAGVTVEGPIDGMVFAWIPSGSFSMGSPSSEYGHISSEGPVHAVTIRGFEMMTTEVTQGMWEEVVGTLPLSVNDLADWGVGSDYPVYAVSWDECQMFVDSLNARDSVYTYRLPSEAEWEYACRAGTSTAYYWGDSVDSTYCWYDGNSEALRPVGQKLPNAWGLFDMSGNVSEWCEDSYNLTYDGVPGDGSPWYSAENSYRVVRGGSICDAGWIRSASRAYGIQSPESNDISRGFRLARSAR